MQRHRNNLKSTEMTRLFSILFLFLTQGLLAQVNVEGIIAVVGNNIILKSDVEQQVLQYQAQGLEVDSTMRTQVFEDLLFQKLMLHKAEIDSVEVTENEVNNEVESRLNNFILQLGGEEQLEQYFDKKVYKIKEEMFDPIKESLLIKRVRYGITSSVDVTPAEVETHFNTYDSNALPEINETVQVAQILKLPPANEFAIQETNSKLNKLKQRVVKGENFATLAILYSEDPGSSRNGGLYTGIRRGMFVKEFEAVMFSLEDGEISEVFQTEYGYHIVQMVERRTDEVDIRHILMSPKISPIDLNNAKELLTVVRDSVLDGDLTFDKAVMNHSNDDATKYNGGKLINPNTGTSSFELLELQSAVKMATDELEVGEISEPAYVKLEDGKEAYRVFKLLRRTSAHKANFKDDYKMIRDLALESKKEETIVKWVESTLSKTYVYIADSYQSPAFQYQW